MTDIAASTATTATISVGGTVTGSLEVVGDHDWYAITLTAGQTLVFSEDGSGLTPRPDSYLSLRDASGNVIAWNDDSGGTLNSSIYFQVTTSGTYYLDAGAWDTQSQDSPPTTNTITGTYSLSVQNYTAPPVYNYDQIANQLTNGYWTDYDGQGRHHFNVTQGGSITVNISTLTAAEQTLALAALGQWHDIIGVNFQTVTTGGQIVFSDAEDPSSPDGIASTTASSSGGITTKANIDISTSWVNTYGTSLDSYSFQTYLHEIGHALGLGHAGDYNGDATYATDAIFANDSWNTSVMSYFSATDNFYFANQGFTQNFLVTPMDADIVAMQNLYGLSTTTRTGNTTYGFNSNAGNLFNASVYPDVAYTIFDSGGTDTLDYSGFSNNQLINLNPETFMNVGANVGNVMIARGVTIENAIGGSGDDTIIGNAVANTLTGNGGNDTIDGGAAADTMVGGLGDDTYYVDNAGDVVTENAGQGTDQVNASINYTLGANVENLTLTGSSALNGTGNALSNVITGNGAANVLNGGAGADTLAGGTGNDTYMVDDAADVVTENPGEGTDTVNASISYTLAANVENLTLTGSAAINGTGNGLANVLRGNAAANVLDGGAGNDQLYAGAGNDTLLGGTGNDILQGSTGADAMTGGIGNDTYYVDNAGDVVTENAAEGTDLVNAAVSYTLAANVENLTLSDGSAIDGAGNALANVIHGNTSANTLDGGDGNDQLYGGGGNDSLLGGLGNDRLDGGTGTDSLTGGAGDDSYYVDSASDLVIENASEGTDVVYASSSFTLGANIEKLTLTGSGDISGTGNALNNVIHGTTGNNVLSGGDGNDSLYGAAGNDTLSGGNGIDHLDGGLGADAMAGGAGDDSYYVDNVGDTVIENASEGTDAVYSSVSFTLSANVEKLVLTGLGAIDGTGNGLLNVIRGNEAANTLSGLAGNDQLYGNGGADTLIGGAGTDHMTGGAGNDLFVFDDGAFGGTTASTADEIVDFTAGADTIDLSAVDANSLLGGDQAFAFIGTNAFSDTAGELRYEQISGNTYLTGDTNGDGIADFMIKVDGSHVFTGSDFGL